MINCRYSGQYSETAMLDTRPPSPQKTNPSWPYILGVWHIWVYGSSIQIVTDQLAVVGDMGHRWLSYTSQGPL